MIPDYPILVTNITSQVLTSAQERDLKAMIKNCPDQMLVTVPVGLLRMALDTCSELRMDLAKLRDGSEV